MVAANLQADAQRGLFAAEPTLLQLQNTPGTPTRDRGFCAISSESCEDREEGVLGFATPIAFSGFGSLGFGPGGEDHSLSSGPGQSSPGIEKGFRLYWRWKSRPRRPGRPALDREVQDLIRRMSQANPLWGAPRIHGELLKLGIDVCETTIAKYMVRASKPPSQSWRAFLNNHLAQIVAVDCLRGSHDYLSNSLCVRGSCP